MSHHFILRIESLSLDNKGENSSITYLKMQFRPLAAVLFCLNKMLKNMKEYNSS